MTDGPSDGAFEGKTPPQQRVYCSCGGGWQTQAGWDAQGLAEDLPNGKMKLHNLPPESCEEVDDT